MNYREKNIELLQQYRPLFLERYTQWEEQEIEPVNPCDNVYVTEAKDGQTVLHVVRDGKDHRLNSPYRPLAEAKRWTEQFNYKNIHTNVVLFGMGNCLFVKEMLDRLREDATLALYEPSMDIWQWAMESIDLSKVIQDERVHLIVEDLNRDSLGEYLKNKCHWTSIGSQITCHHTGYDTLFAHSYRDVLADVQSQMNLAVVNRDTQAHFSHHYVLNSIQNLEYIFEAGIISDYLKDIPLDIPFIIVSAGPSLDKNIDLLKEAKGHSFIMATDTAVRFLLQHDIMPDAMVTIDAKKPESYISDERVKDVPLFCCQESNHKILHFHTGKKIWFKGGGFLGNLFEQHSKTFPPYNVGGSVATAAFLIGAAFEFKNIILIGQDLAYSGDVTHAGGTVSKILNEEHGLKMIEGIDGNPVKSRYDWLIYLSWFESSIKELEKLDKEIRVIDATEGGAKIHGSTIMTLREVLDECCDFSKEIDIKGILENKEPVFDEQQRQEVMQYLENCYEDMQELPPMAEDAVAVCDKALKIVDSAAVDSKSQRKKQGYIDRIMNYNALIEKSKCYELIDVYISDVASAVLRGVYQVTDDPNKDELELLHSAKAIYTAAGSSADELLPDYEKMLGLLKNSF
ncbi:MAG: motility associated factor glycosyltransferase family protein [Lachnospiraceae bacterium]|nr:motility associated factor glycosyltransferase family protein [Lachnospiraceae bacterium]